MFQVFIHRLICIRHFKRELWLCVKKHESSIMYSLFCTRTLEYGVVCLNVIVIHFVIIICNEDYGSVFIHFYFVLFNEDCGTIMVVCLKSSVIHFRFFILNEDYGSVFKVAVIELYVFELYVFVILNENYGSVFKVFSHHLCIRHSKRGQW